LEQSGIPDGIIVPEITPRRGKEKIIIKSAKILEGIFFQLSLDKPISLMSIAIFRANYVAREIQPYIMKLKKH
jgi:hypothetical protein